MNSLKPSPEIAKLIKAEAWKERARRNFWDFCQLLAPEFYRDDRPHLKKLCDILQALYEGRLYRNDDGSWLVSGVVIPGRKACKKLMINMPPQHGKSRTLFMFCTWVFGRNVAEKIITASYNDTTASDFSRYTRDGISMQKNYPDHIVYSDVFPKTRIKQGHGGFEKWALDGQHFSYLGTGIGGSVTSKGATILILDDPIKGAKEARSETVINNVWTWYTSTFSSRVAAEDGEPIEIMNMTRWTIHDPCGKTLADEIEAKEWYVLKMEVYDEKTDTMLCPKIMGKNRYLSLKRKMDKDIFMANYHQEPFDIEDKLFPADELNYYIPNDALKKEFNHPLSYIDVADQGSDYLAQAFTYNVGTRVYLPDVIFMHEDSKDSGRNLCAEKIKVHKPVTRSEANGMGHIFTRELCKLVPWADIEALNQTANKHARILMLAGFIRRNFWFVHPDYQDEQYRAFMRNLCAYNKEGKVDNDDAADCLAGVAHMVQIINDQYYQ